MAYLSFKSKYNQYPTVAVKENKPQVWEGYDQIIAKIKEENPKVLLIDCYLGVDYEELKTNLFSKLAPELVVFSDECAFEAEKIVQEMKHHITDDRVFGVMSHHSLEHFFYPHKIKEARAQIENTKGLVIVYGVGASLITSGDINIYADMTRWELQQRYRSGKLGNWRDSNYNEDILRRYKRGYFMEWRWADEHKKKYLPKSDYYLDTIQSNMPKMITKESYDAGARQVISQPFRLKPYFDPGVWGGQWMKEVCNLDSAQSNYAWAFDGVPEENSILLDYQGALIEIPAINIVLEYPIALLGERVFARFGAEFPIRFDFLDTMGGQNLSLQVHPNTEYAYKTFGIRYTQDESYYILDATDDAVVYLGLKDGINSHEMMNDLRDANVGKKSFAADKYVNCIPCKKHDHFLIPAGTVHCSGKNSMVLEISATPYIFTFKLWDWDRLGLDGLPRPVHIDHGKEVIAWDRTTDWVNKELVNHVTILEQNDNYLCERTGLHTFEFIETQRYTIYKEVLIHTEGSVHMLNLIDGEEITVFSPNNAFDPFVVHYAETFIIPESCQSYKIIPSGNSQNKEIKVLKASVK
ncbi:MAG: class I mannose-6-phosphate isomerase [Brevinema sp.]